MQSNIKIIVFLAFVFSTPQCGMTQEANTYDIAYGVHRVLPSLSVTKATLAQSKVLLDINPYYEASWVKAYKDVTISIVQEGMLKTSKGVNDQLTEEQQSMLANADTGSDITVSVNYLPNNTLQHNELKENTFVVKVEPESHAQFPGGESKLIAYLKDRGIDQITTEVIPEHQLASITFIIDDKGNILNSHISNSSQNDEVDTLLLNTVCDMPTWEPATLADGTTIEEEYVLVVGDMKSCVVNLLQIRHLPKEN